ncbi:cytochrome P450 [Coprinopsis sp. MPI-PUGE-AT-0042]|nr:cytochrome P450 [Coprinopsis sp. MPI-PUGE-AT-0042]
MSLPLAHVAQVVGACGTVYLLSALIRRALAKDPYAALPTLEGGSFLFGHLPHINGVDSHNWLENLADNEGSAVKLGMFLGDNTIILSDPKALYHVLVKDQHKFEEADVFLASNKVTLGDGLLSTHGDQHRKQRKTLNPVFSIKHMRGMVPTFDEITLKLAGTLGRLVSDGEKEIEVFEWLTRAALELVGQSGFGYSFDPLTEDAKEHPFVTSVKLIMPLSHETFIAQMIVLPTVQRLNLGGKRLQRFVMENLTWGSYRKLVDVVDVMHNTSVEIFEARKQALAQKEKDLHNDEEDTGKDILTSLMQANMTNNAEDRLPDDEILAQISDDNQRVPSTFAFAGMDTTSSATARLMWLLAEHQDVQDRLRAEIREAKSKYGRPSYDELVALPYMDACSPNDLQISNLGNDEVKEDAVLPLYRPIRGTDGKEITELLFRKGSSVFISILSCNRSRDLWGPDALEWKPERWFNDLPKELIEAKVPGVYSNLMTFLGGSRACIGFKFAQLEMKMMVFNLLDHLKFRPGKKEVFWRGRIVGPAVDLNNIRPELPLMVERIGDVATH